MRSLLIKTIRKRYEIIIYVFCSSYIRCYAYIQVYMCCFGKALFAWIIKDKTTIWQILATGVTAYFLYQG